MDVVINYLITVPHGRTEKKQRQNDWRLAVFSPARSSAAEDVRKVQMPMADNSLQKTAKTARNAMSRMTLPWLYAPRERVRTLD
jgi:hypothetical protein